MAKTFLWIEDRKGKASYTFWENLMKHLCPDVIVESKKNNSELVKAVRALQMLKTDISLFLIIPLIICRLLWNRND